VPLTCVVLAAGFSSRLGRPKQLLVVDGEPLVRRAARMARMVAATVVIVPPDAPAIRGALEGLDIEIVENPSAAEGIASSIRSGMAATAGDVLLCVCDQPRITSAHLQALVDTRAAIAATGYSGSAGVPALFSAAFRDELVALQGDTGAKKVIERHRDVVAVVPFEDAAFDVDEESDYQRTNPPPSC
jgi:molybdenum cofactor cytidylyltransferase